MYLRFRNNLRTLYAQCNYTCVTLVFLGYLLSFTWFHLAHIIGLSPLCIFQDINESVRVVPIPLTWFHLCISHIIGISPLCNFQDINESVRVVPIPLTWFHLAHIIGHRSYYRHLTSLYFAGYKWECASGTYTSYIISLIL